MFGKVCFCLTVVEQMNIENLVAHLIFNILALPACVHTSLAKRCTMISSVFATLNMRIKAVPKKEMIVCKMNGNYPELFGKGTVTSCISDDMKYVEESEKCHLIN
mgnify:CR=1 FL=1